MDDIMEIVKTLKECGLLMKRIRETTENEAKEQQGTFVGMLLGVLGTSLLRNLLTGRGVIQAVKGTVRAGQDF